MRRKGLSKHSFPRTYSFGLSSQNHDYQAEATKDEYAARLAEVPPDDRTPIQRLLNDPPAWQSALTQRRLA